MNSRRKATFLLQLLAAFFVAENSLALPNFKKNQKETLPAILKADEVDGDQATNTLNATGNVEVSKGPSVIYADKMIYEKNGGIIRAIGNVKIRDLEIGNVRATKAEVKDDFASGKFFESQIIFTDGSYLTSPEINRKNAITTVLDHPIFSICPNPEISADNSQAGKKRDMISISSKQTTIDRQDDVMRSKGGIMRFYNVPFFYTPYLSVALPSKKKKSGFLHPSYAKSTNLGLGVRLPYYFYIAPNVDLTVTPLIGVSNGQILVNNEFRHKASYGEYKINAEIANNEIKNTNNTTVTNRTDDPYRWNLKGDGKFDFTKNVGLDFKSDLVSDRDYLRDYDFSFLNYTVSKVNFDYINKRSYHAVKLIKIQELENSAFQKSEPLILPQIDSYIESKPRFFKEKFALTSNTTMITRHDGLQYRRATLTPEVDVPFNLSGNLFNFNGKIQNDFYWLKEASGPATTASNNQYQTIETNTKPEFSFSWKLPLIRKTQTNTLLVEPMLNVVASSYRKNFNALPNEDSNSSELSVSNLFVADRIAGFDRNESGKRLNYGVKTSFFHKTHGQFALTIGQGYKKSENAQDAVIKGFGTNSKSNFVGQALYKAKKYFSINYLFQLNESNYQNEVNQVSSILTFEKFSLTADYLLIATSPQNLQKIEQMTLSSKVKLSNKWSLALASNQDIQLGRELSRSVSILRDGCCTTFGFSVVETNPSALTKPQKSFNLSLLFKNL
ncbi:MAG: LPS-assembly protein LptD [Rickettsiales bacterium]|nr:LPS-assembly protein LptD [Rickettsiales bacterium]